MNTKQYILSIASLLAALSSPVLSAAEDSQDVLKAEAKVSLGDASRAALAKIPGGTIESSELERENGILVWSFDISKRKSKIVTEIQVDAKTGAIVSQTVETPAQEAEEAAKESAKHK
jgi:uncharacterized membrane protein YkoI